MKYIRTKDGIIDLANIVGYHQIVDGYNEKGEKAFKYLDLNSKGRFKIIKEADIIEELCDYCIYYNHEKELIFRKMPLRTSLKSLYGDMKLGFVSEIKFAILTDKGLIYVAKMNQEGVLELL